MLTALDRFVEEKYKKKELPAARALGIAQQVLNRARKNRRVGRGIADALAKAYGVGTLEKLIALAADPWPNRMLAVPIAKEAGASAVGIKRVLSWRYDNSPDQPRLVWAVRMMEASRDAEKERLARRL